MSDAAIETISRLGPEAVWTLAERWSGPIDPRSHRIVIADADREVWLVPPMHFGMPPHEAPDHTWRLQWFADDEMRSMTVTAAFVVGQVPPEWQENVLRWTTAAAIDATAAAEMAADEREPVSDEDLEAARAIEADLAAASSAVNHNRTESLARQAAWWVAGLDRERQWDLGPSSAVSVDEGVLPERRRLLVPTLDDPLWRIERAAQDASVDAGMTREFDPFDLVELLDPETRGWVVSRSEVALTDIRRELARLVTGGPDALSRAAALAEGAAQLSRFLGERG